MDDLREKATLAWRANELPDEEVQEFMSEVLDALDELDAWKRSAGGDGPYSLNGLARRVALAKLENDTFKAERDHARQKLAEAQREKHDALVMLEQIRERARDAHASTAGARLKEISLLVREYLEDADG